LFRRIGFAIQPDTAACRLALPPLRENVVQASFQIAFNAAADAAGKRTVVFPHLAAARFSHRSSPLKKPADGWRT
jgi:hypothetical protein